MRPDKASQWGDELRNALAFALFAAIYALMVGGVFHFVAPAAPRAILTAWFSGYALAVLFFGGAQAIAWVLLHAPARRRGVGLLPLAGPLACLAACAVALPQLFRARDLAELVGTSAFLGAGLALSTARDFYASFQRALVPARRVRDFLAQQPAAGRRLLQSICPILAFGPIVPWLAGGIVMLALPAPLRVRLAAYLLILTFLAHHLNRKLLEELAVWVFLHALRVGAYAPAARLRIRPTRLAAEIEAAPPDLEAPFARFIAWGMHGAEGMDLTPAALSRLVRVHLSVYGLAVGGRDESGPTPLGCVHQPGGMAGAIEPSLVRRLLEHGVRFRLDAEAPSTLEPPSLPSWPELLRPEGRGRLAALCPGEPLWQAVLRRYEPVVRAMLLPLSLVWLPLLGLSLALAGSGAWALPLAGAALSFALLLWMTLFYGNWIFDRSLRRRDFAFLARQLGAGKMRGELEDALGSRDPLVRDRAVELLLFNDDIARLGITVPPAGLRNFLKRTA